MTQSSNESVITENQAARFINDVKPSTNGEIPMQIETYTTETDRYARCVEISQRIRWDIDADVIRGRKFDFGQKFLPDALSKIDELDFLTSDQKRLLSQIQGRTYANIFGLVERFISAKILEVSKDHWFGDQVALESLIRFTDEELKHQELFRRIEKLCAEDMPEGYSFTPDPNEVAAVVLGKLLPCAGDCCKDACLRTLLALASVPGWFRRGWRDAARRERRAKCNERRGGSVQRDWSTVTGGRPPDDG